MNKLVILALVLIPSAGLAQPQGERIRAARPALDPNHTICRRYRESGTRIVIRRVCMTRAQWADNRREIRQNVDRAQMTRVITK